MLLTESAFNCLVKQKDLTDLVPTIINKPQVTFKESMSKVIEMLLQDQIDAVGIENENVKLRLDI